MYKLFRNYETKMYLVIKYKNVHYIMENNNFLYTKG